MVHRCHSEVDCYNKIYIDGAEDWSEDQHINFSSTITAGIQSFSTVFQLQILVFLQEVHYHGGK